MMVCLDVAYQVVALDKLGSTQPQRFQELLRVCLGLDQPHWQAPPLTSLRLPPRVQGGPPEQLRDGYNIGVVVPSASLL